MHNLTAILFLQIGASPIQAVAPQSCAQELGATQVAHRLSDVPKDILADLMRIDKAMGDHDSPLLQTDAPSAEQLKWPTSRFLQAMLIDKTWYVQVQASMMSGVATMGYRRGGDGQFQRSRSSYLAGPACETLKAAAKGVYNPGLFDF